MLPKRSGRCPCIDMIGVLLDDGDGVVGDPVGTSPEAKPPSINMKISRHPRQRSSFAPDRRGRVQPLLHPHRDAQDDRQRRQRKLCSRSPAPASPVAGAEQVPQAGRIRAPKVAIQPSHGAWRSSMVTKITCRARKRSGSAKRTGKQPAAGVHLFALVKLHHLFWYFIRSSPVRFPDRLHLGLEFFIRPSRHRDCAPAGRPAASARRSAR